MLKALRKKGMALGDASNVQMYPELLTLEQLEDRVDLMRVCSKRLFKNYLFTTILVLVALGIGAQLAAYLVLLGLNPFFSFSRVIKTLIQAAVAGAFIGKSLLWIT